jgi:hypothetical protein
MDEQVIFIDQIGLNQIADKLTPRDTSRSEPSCSLSCRTAVNASPCNNDPFHPRLPYGYATRRTWGWH